MKFVSKISVVLMAIFLFLGAVNAQTKEEKKVLKKARKALTQGSYEKAKGFYSSLLELDKTNSMYYFEAGLTYYNSYYQREKALPLFDNALAYSTKDTISEIFLYLGKTNQYLDNFSKAIDYYNKFKEYTKDNKEGTFVLLEVDHLIEMCNNGVQLQENKANESVTTENLGGRINSRYAEYGQVVNSKSDMLLFTTRDRENVGRKLYNDNKKYEDIYISTKENGKWVTKMNVDSANHIFSGKINTKKHDAVIGFSDMDEKLYVYQKNGILVSTKKNGKYQTPVPLKTINSTGREPSAFLTKDGKTMFFSSSRAGGKGGLDLYYSFHQADGTWSEPVNMVNLNTSLNEDAPYLSSDGNELYFASQGHNSVGGYDIFKSVKDENGMWMKPENIGLNYNSGGDDIYYIHDTIDEVGYFSSSRANGYGDVDIYKFYPTPASQDKQLFAGVGKPAYKITNSALYLDKETGNIYVRNNDKWELSRERIGSGSGEPTGPPFIPANIYINTDNANIFAKEDKQWTDYGGGVEYGNGDPLSNGSAGDVYVNKDNGKAFVFENGKWIAQKGTVTIGKDIPSESAEKGAVYVSTRTGHTYVFDGVRWHNKKGGLIEGEGEPLLAGKSGDIYLNSDNADLYIHDGEKWKNIDKGMLETKGPPKEIEEKGAIYYDKAGDDIYVSDGEKWVRHSDEIGGDNECDNIANTEIRGLAYQGDFNNPVYVTITAFNLATNEEVGQWESDRETGQYLMILPPNNTYYLEITNPDWNTKRPFRDTIVIPKQCEVYQLFQKIHFNEVKGENLAQEAIMHNAMFDVKNEALNTFGVENIEDAITTAKSNISIKGSVNHNEVLPTNNVEVSLVNNQGEIIQTTNTNKNGEFVFNNVSEATNYGLLINEADVKLSYYGNQPKNSENSIVLNGNLALYNNEALAGNNEEIEVILIDNDKKVISKTIAGSEGEFVLDNVSTENVDDRSFKYQVKATNEDEVYASYLSTIDTSENEFYSIVRDLLDLNEEEIVSEEVVVTEDVIEGELVDNSLVAEDIEETETVKQVNFTLNPIYFDFDKFFLRLNSKDVLSKIYEYMNNNPEFTLEIVGHTDWMGSDEYNLKLSKKRAISAFKYLTNKGISEDNLVIKWVGESQPKVPNANPDGSDNPDNRQLNRRCEFKFQSNDTAYSITIM